MFTPPSIRIDTRLVDNLVLRVISERCDPVTRQSTVTLEEISYLVGCHLNTACSATKRLVAAGRLQKSGGRGRPGITYKVSDELAVAADA